MRTVYFSLALILCIFSQAHAQRGDVRIIDSRHYSSVLGEIRNYRIFLPPAYYDNPGKHYPVIYYYHGWSQRYFGSTDHSSIGIDKGTDNYGDNIANYVADHEVIVVKPDGYNRYPDEDYYLRPYNVSPVESHRQFPLYFPELVDHIDGSYRTIADRNHRAISGLSMGGFMTFWIGGKYPHLLSAAGNFCGSTEFYTGVRDMPAEYRHIDMYKNYGGMNVRLNYGDKDFIRAYHQDMNRVWTRVMDNYEYEIYDAAHSNCGFSEMFDFIMETFENPPDLPRKWHHSDVYPGFSVWGYQIESDRRIPGFTTIENVDKRGFRCSVRETLPDGELMPFVQLSVRTAPLYKKNHPYRISDTDLRSGIHSISSLQSDPEGRLSIHLNGSQHEIGINDAEAPHNICVASYEIANMGWATRNKEVAVSLELLNKGGEKAESVSIRMVSRDKETKIIQDECPVGDIAAGEIRKTREALVFIVTADSIEMQRFEIEIWDKSGLQWSSFIDIPLMTDRPEISDFEIADGKMCTVMEAGDDTVSLFLGKGNGDGIANPGESLVILARDQGGLRRTFLYSSDPYINPAGINIRKSDNWGSYDHVGGSAKYSVPLIASDCPKNHRIEFFAEYWLPDYPDHPKKRGKIEIKVRGKDLSPPVLRWADISGDNVIEARVYDGGDIPRVRAILKSKDQPEHILSFDLNDDGLKGDREAGDFVFSFRIPEQLFGLYQIEIEAEDAPGNKMVEKVPGEFVLH